MAASLSPPPTVLLVEDDESNRELYGLTLTQAGYSTTLAHDGYDALEKARALPPSLVITDILMPHMDGWELCRRLRADPRTHDAGIIAITGAILGESFDERALECDLDRLLFKPCLPDRLLKEVRRVLARGRLARSRGQEQIVRSQRLRARSLELYRRSLGLASRFDVTRRRRD
jgi:CheY-like chemotaxis protein